MLYGRIGCFAVFFSVLMFVVCLCKEEGICIRIAFLFLVIWSKSGQLFRAIILMVAIGSEKNYHRSNWVQEDGKEEGRKIMNFFVHRLH